MTSTVNHVVNAIIECFCPLPFNVGESLSIVNPFSFICDLASSIVFLWAISALSKASILLASLPILAAVYATKAAIARTMTEMKAMIGRLFMA